MSPRELPTSIGRYEVIDRLGHGGMGIVYLGRDPRIGRRVAIKLLRVPDDEIRERFLQEAQSAGNLKHRNIVTIYDYGEHHGQPFIVMEFVEGTTLADQVRSGFPFTLTRQLEIIEELSSGLDYAHEQGLVHRDVKPANIMLGRDGVLKILDFGIARVADSGLTRVGVMMGTPNYMSPEQIEGKAVDRRSDIFAVGLLFYELLACRQAFAGETAHAVMSKILTGAPTPLSQACPGVDPEIERIVNQALQKDPDKRYQTLAHLGVDVARVRERLTLGATRGPSSATVIWQPPPPTPASKRTPRTGTDRDPLAKKRQERIQLHLDVAQRAFDGGEYSEALEACELAAMLDPDEPRVVELLDRTREAVDAQKIRSWLVEARDCLRLQDVEGSRRLVDQALEVNAASAEACAVGAEIDEFERQRKQREERREAVAASLGRARTALATGDPEEAVRAAGEALIHEPANGEAHEITRLALAALDERRQRQERDRLAHEAIDAQRREFGAGRRHEALSALERFTPEHPLVTEALEELRSDLLAIEQRERDAEARRVREELEAEQRREDQARWLASQLELARTALAAHQFADAAEVLERVRAVVPDAAGLAGLLGEARAGQAALEAEAARRRTVAENLNRATAERGQGHLAEALARVNEVLRLSPDLPEALEERRAIEAAVEAQRLHEAAAAAADAAVKEARRQFDAGNHASALASLDAFSPKHPAVDRAREQLLASIAAIEREQEERAKRTRAEAVRAALARATDALRSDALGDGLSALGDVAELEPANVDAANLRALIVERELQLEQLSVAFKRGREAADAGDFETAMRAANEMLVIDGQSTDARALRARAATGLDAARRRIEEEEARRRAEAARAAREDRIVAQCGAARGEIADGRFAEAVDRLRRLLAADGADARVEALLKRASAQRTAADERARVEAQIADLLADARRQIDRTDFAAAAVGIEGALALDPAHPDARQARIALEEHQREHVRKEEERARVEEEQRQAALEQDVRQQIAKARSHLERQQYNKAIRLIDKVRPRLSGIASPDILSSELDAIVSDARQQQQPREDVSGGAETTPGRNWKAAAATAAVLVTALAAWTVLRDRGEKPQVVRPSATSVMTTITPTTVPSPPATTSVPGPTLSSVTPAPDFSKLAASIGVLVERGNLAEAGRAFSAAPPGAADDPAVAAAVKNLLDVAARRADAARRAADRAGSPNKPAYGEAIQHMTAAAGSRRTGRAEPAVLEYLTSEKLFVEAAREPTRVAAVTTAPVTIPVTRPSASSTVPSTVAPTVLSTIATSSVAPTSIVPTLDQPTAKRLLDEYAAAARSLDLGAMERAYPALRLSDLTKRRIAALKSNFRYCEYQLANIRVVFSTATEASVQADAVESCKPPTGQGMQQLNGAMQFTLRKTATGWTFITVFGPS